MSVVYREAQLADAPELRELFAKSFVETFGHLYPPEDLQAFLDDNSEAKWRANLSDPEVAIQIADTDGEYAGFVELAPKKLPHETTAPALELRRLYLRSSAQGRGIADALMKWALREAARRGAAELVLSVFIDNHRARRFYERYGFEIVGRYDFMVGSHADEDIIMRKRL